MTGCLAVVMAAISGDLARTPSERTASARHSRYDADETLRKIEHAARRHGYTVFARVAMPADAPPANRPVVLVLGTPEGVTPVVVDERAASIEAPLALTIVPAGDGRAQVHVPEPAAPWTAALTPLAPLVEQALA
ncbi:hypothetical protein C1702_06130 [Caldimonas thermodepolymerans]|nr:hypothetical protein C1702_06130 [Caldimonas thermodepolymerans]